MANTIKVSNASGGDILIADLGFTIPDSTTDMVLEDQGFELLEIRNSVDLQDQLDLTDITAKDENDDAFTDLAELKLHNHLITNPNDLQGIGSGVENNIITIDANGLPKDSSVAISAITQTYYKQATAPVTTAIWFDTDLGYSFEYDSVRSKWLSTAEKDMGAARSQGSTTNQYLRVFDSMAMSTTGWRAPLDITIVGLIAQTEGVETWILELRKNKAVAVLDSLSISAAVGAQDLTIDIDIDQGETIELFCNGTSIAYPIGRVLYKYRNA